jgi:hypothetical protein
MTDSVLLRNAALRSRLKELVPASAARPAGGGCARPPAMGPFARLPYPGEPADVVVTLNEITDRHGTGPLLKRLLRGRPNVLSIRSRDDWGRQDYPAWNQKVTQGSPRRHHWYRNVLHALGGARVANVLCVPFLPDEVRTAIAVHGIFGARLCTYVMDDQNVAAHGIPDALMEELLARSCLRLATHPELRTAYESKFGVEFHLLPAVVPDPLIRSQPVDPVDLISERRGALLGSFWDQSWFDRLCLALDDSGYTIDWFGNADSPWLRFPREAMERAGVRPRGVIPEDELARELGRFPFVIVPVGALDGAESNPGVAALSLPGRILFAAATSNTPILIVGNTRTCGSRFVSHFGLGETVPYDALALRAAMDRLSHPDAQAHYRPRAVRIAPKFSDRGVAEWLFASIALGRPADARYEEAFAGYGR